MPNNQNGNTRKCYARILGGCDGGLSREHIVSEAILDNISPTNCIDVINPHWAKGETKRVGKRRLTARVLCLKHNSLLSPLDTEMATFQAHVGRALSQHNKANEIECIDGNKIERWMLKVLLGLCVDDHLEPDPIYGDIYDWGIRATFGGKELPIGMGLYVSKQIKFESENQFGVRILVHNGKTIPCLSILIYGVPLSLLVQSNARIDSTVYRPGDLFFVKNGSTRQVQLKYNNFETTEFISYHNVNV